MFIRRSGSRCLLQTTCHFSPPHVSLFSIYIYIITTVSLHHAQFQSDRSYLYHTYRGTIESILVESRRFGRIASHSIRTCPSRWHRVPMAAKWGWKGWVGLRHDTGVSNGKIHRNDRLCTRGYLRTYVLRGRNSLVKLVYKFESVPFDQIQYSDPFNPIGRQWWKINRP